ncbi:hypothetical protein AWH04_28645 [Rhodococcus erythropolis]|nr:hypothetical protein AWH04_28645 [Rhodococcus erythropolis]
MGIARRLVPGEAFGSVVHRPQPQFQRQSESRLFGVTSGVGLNTAAPTRQSYGTALPAGIGSPDSKVSEVVRVVTPWLFAERAPTDRQSAAIRGSRRMFSPLVFIETPAEGFDPREFRPAGCGR